MGKNIKDTLATIEAEIGRLADIIAAPRELLPTYGHTVDFAHPHIELTPRLYHYIVVERGQKMRHDKFGERDDLLYTVFQSVTFSMALTEIVGNTDDGRDQRRDLWPAQLRLLRTLNPLWAQRREKEIENTLNAHPYNDRRTS